MKLPNSYVGADDPFEGDRTLWLRSLPAGVRVTRATVRVEPQGGLAFHETFVFDGATGSLLDADDWGVVRIPEAGEGRTVEVSFGNRRTLAQVSGTGGSATLQVDLGGAYVPVAENGTLGSGEGEWPVDLTSSGSALPGLTVNKFMLTAPNASITLTINQVTVRSVPTNVSVGIDDLPPFWTHVGELAIAQTSADMSDVLNAYLATVSAENGFYTVPLVVHSDTIARLNVTLDLEYVVEQTILPSYLPEVTLPYGYSSLPGVEEGLLTVRVPRGSTVVSTGGTALGTFDATRVVHGEIGETPATATVTVTPGRSLAQPIQLPSETPVSGIDLPLAHTQTGLAGLHLALQADADGKPSGEELASAPVTVEKPAPGGSSWGSAALAREFRFERDKRYWLVLQSVSGEAYWDVGPGDPAIPALQDSTSGGLAWRMAATEAGERPLRAVYRLRHTPDRYSVPLQLQIGKGPDVVRARFDRYAPLGRVEFDLDFGTKLGEYLTSPAAASPCGSGELLTNGSFEQPPHDDATRRLFGFEADESPEAVIGEVDLRRGVNLSVERFITLSDSGSPPCLARIDCAGANPAHTSLNEIIDAINRAMGRETASEYQFQTDTSSAPERTGRLKLQDVSLNLWCKAEVPTGWQGTPGRVARVKVGGRVISVLVAPPSLREDFLVCLDSGPSTLSPTEPARLTQCVPVAGGCVYVLSFLVWGSFMLSELTAPPASDPVIHIVQAGENLFRISLRYGTTVRALMRANYLTSTTIYVGQRLIMPGSYVPPFLIIPCPILEYEVPSWEVRWLDAEGQLVHSEGEQPVALGLSPTDIDWFFQSEVRLTAPPGASYAEIRFIQRPSGILLLEDVSFVPTLETVGNAAFRFWKAQQVAGGDLSFPLEWTVGSGWVDPDSSGVLLRGTGPDGEVLSDDTVLVQRVNVLAGGCYELRVRARPVGTQGNDPEVLPDQRHARLELRWLIDEDEIGKAVILPLDGRGFPTRAWTGAAPDGTTQAEIRLIQPQGRGDLLVGSVSFSRVDMVSVPLTFLAEAPGELTVSDLRVAYDLPEPPSHVVRSL